MQHQHVAFRHDQTVLIFQLRRGVLNQAEEPVAPGRYMGAVLNVVGRPELPGCDEVLPVEESLERFENEGLVSLGCKFPHFGSPWLCRQRFSLSLLARYLDYVHTPEVAEKITSTSLFTR